VDGAGRVLRAMRPAHPDQLAMGYTYAPRFVVCFSGGHSSALVAVEVVRRYGTAGVVLLNHDINPRVEDADIKRFKREVAVHLNLPITQADHPRVAEWDQFDVTEHARAFKVKNGEELCTNRLKTAPFRAWLAGNCPPGTATLHYGFDAEEQARILRRSTIAAEWGYATAYPLAHWQRTIQSTREIGVEPPLTYSTFRHANCVGCLKAGWQHWYVVRATRPDVWERAKLAEERIGHSIHKDAYLHEREAELDEMIDAGVVPTEHMESGTFWSRAKRMVRPLPLFDEIARRDERPCECVV
jgi:hypothetical protein